jgi:hypothetical protein
MANSILSPTKIAKKPVKLKTGMPQAMAKAKAIPKAKGPGQYMKMAKGKL